MIARYEDIPWTPSPAPGVERRILERDGGEIARATTIVRYAKGSTFPAHVHGLGEEFLVLEGTFADEHGRYDTGTYVRNPPGSTHRPFSIEGCIIFVKLRQIPLEDTRRCVIAAGRESTVLHTFGRERSSLVRVDPGAVVEGAELLVLEGSLGDHPRWTWLRDAGPLRSRDGALVWRKEGHAK